MDLALLALASETAESLQADALYYRQADGIYYGGWTDYPHAVIELFPMKFHPVSGIRQAVLDMANAAVNFNLPMLPQAIRDEALALERRGWITRCARGAKAKQYRSYPNHLIGLGKWSITGRCNYRCRHCFLSAPDARFGELPTAECLRIIREMAEVGIHAVTLTGGEPLVREDFLTLVDELCKHDITVTQIATNGALVNERLLDALEDRGVRPIFAMSFDGVGWHDWLRGIPGAEKQLMGKFELLARRGFTTSSAMTLHRKNVGVLRESINRLADVGASLAIINRMLEVGEWLKNGECLTLSQAEIFQAYLDYLPCYYADGKHIKVTLNRIAELYPGSYEYDLLPIKPPCDFNTHTVCSSTYHAFLLNGDGKLTPCIAIAGMNGMQENFADLTKMHLRDALEHSRLAELVGTSIADHQRANPKCMACPYHRWCQGGCPAQALEFDDTNYNGVDYLRCEFFENHWADRIINRLKETVPEARCRNLPADFPLLDR